MNDIYNRCQSLSPSAQLETNDKTMYCPLRGQYMVYGFYI